MRRGAVIGFGVETFALFHTEPVLLVDHHQGQVRGLEGLGKRRVRGHDNARLTTGGRSERLTPGGKLHTTGQQGDGNFRSHLGRRDRRSTGRAHRALNVGRGIGLLGTRLCKGQPRHHLADGLVMLFGKHLSGSHQHRLIAGADRLQHGRERHYGFAGADFALQQTLHGPVTFKIGRDVVHHLTLPGCQCERQRCDEAVAQIGQIGQIRQIGRRTALRCFWLRTWLRNRFAHRRSSCFQRLVQRARMRR